MNTELLNVNGGGTYSNHCDLKGNRRVYKNCKTWTIYSMPSSVVSNLNIIVQKWLKYLNELFWKEGRRCRVCGREPGFITMAIKAICWKCRLESGHPLKRHSFVPQKILNISYHENLNTLLGKRGTTGHVLCFTSLFRYASFLKQDMPTQFRDITYFVTWPVNSS
jgi:hypothetical protein